MIVRVSYNTGSSFEFVNGDFEFGCEAAMNRGHQTYMLLTAM